MPSIIPGYEYDVFISYRQKDNKGDRWVSEFVEALKTELESAFKEDISVYYDINQHDGLLETHDVDDSLKDKLRCLIFLPVISRTYCDPRSFAWTHEFRAFVELASNDRFGLKVKLPNGNVANRVLPVRIHELDPEDVKLCESLTGGFLRGVEFIYKEPGVNRPLRNNEDRPNDNLNRTYYRNQINKVANAIREVVSGIQAEALTAGTEKTHSGGPLYADDQGKSMPDFPGHAVPARHKILPGLAVAAIIILIGLFLYPKLMKRDKFAGLRDADGRISLAVMPFENLTGDTTLNWFQRGISSLFINRLGNSPELAVRDDQTMFEVIESMNQVFTAGISPSQAKKVAEKASAEAFLSGSFQGINGVYWVLVNLIDTKSGNIIWTNKIEGDLKSSGYLFLVDSLCNELKNYLEIRVLEQKADYDFREVFPESAEAYRYFIEGMNFFLTSEYDPAIKSLKKALEIDSSFTFATFYTAFSYDFSGKDQNRELTSLWTRKAYRTRDKLPLKYQNWLEMWYACFVSENPDDITRYCSLLEKNEIESRLFWFDLGTTYRYMTQQYDKALEAFRRVEQIGTERGTDWKYDNYYTQYTQTLLLARQPAEAKRICEKGLLINPRNYWLIICKASSNLISGDTVGTQKSLTEINTVIKQQKFPDYIREYALGQMYFWAYDSVLAVKHLRQSYHLNPENSDAVYDLILVLIRSGINVREGLELTQKILAKHPDNFFLQWMEGVGYYKSGNYKKALEILRECDQRYMGYLKDFKDDIKKAELAVRDQ